MKLPYMTFKSRHWIADTIGMSDEEQGIYIRLVAMLMNTDEVKWPDTDEFIEKRLVSGSQSLAVYQILDEKFNRDGKWITHDTVSAEFEKAKARKQRSEKGNKARWGNKKKLHPKGSDKQSHARDDRLRMSESESESESLGRGTLKHTQAESQYGGIVTWMPEFETFVESYPRRSGTDPHRPARQEFELLVLAGVNPTDIRLGCERYRDWVDRNGIAPQYVPQMKNFLAQRQWESPWNVDHGIENGKPKTTMQRIATALVDMERNERNGTTGHDENPIEGRIDAPKTVR